MNTTVESPNSAIANGTASLWRLESVDEAGLARLAQLLAFAARTGDVFALRGDLGAGKTTFARAFIRAFARAPRLEVPSPTFAIQQDYVAPRGRLAHFDLYRLASDDEIIETGLDDAIAENITLVEWPDRATEFLPVDLFTLSLHETANASHRTVLIEGRGRHADSVARLEALAGFIADTPWQDADIAYLQGDASPRAYARLLKSDGAKAVLMDWPPIEDGPEPDGTPSYTKRAHLGITTTSFVSICEYLTSLGLSAPQIYGDDVEHGFLLLEDVGDDTLHPTPATVAMGSRHDDMKMAEDDIERYRVATEVAAEIACHEAPATLTTRSGETHDIPEFSEAAQLNEISLLLDWYTQLTGHPSLSQSARDAFFDLWRPHLAVTHAEPFALALRDYHAPNLLWMPERKGLQRIAIIDVQDALRTHAAYDLASLLQDARRDMPADVETELLEHYIKLRTTQTASFDELDFRAAYATLAAQRNTKLLGIFARLWLRDGKPDYLQHLPRIWTYLERAFDAPHLTELKAWFGTEFPTNIAAGRLRDDNRNSPNPHSNGSCCRSWHPHASAYRRQAKAAGAARGTPADRSCT